MGTKAPISSAPAIDEETLLWLERLYPDKLPETNDLPSQALISRLVGQQDVIRHLRRTFTRQSKNVLSPR